MNLAALRAEIRASLEASADPEYRAKISRLVPTGAPLLGVTVPRIRELAKLFRPKTKMLDAGGVLSLVEGQFDGRCREEMLFGTFVLVDHKRTLKDVLLPAIDRFIELIDNWEVCDQLAMNVAAPMVAADPKLSRELVRWASSANPWRRRFAVATAAALNQKGRSLVRETLDVCACLLQDGDPSVQKAVGWALREACKCDEEAVYNLLLERREQVAPRILREGATKLSESRRSSLLGGATAQTSVKRGPAVPKLARRPGAG
ncbi:MAG: DNA alkylation repair protein [Polyangiaceae bacterium]|nr:DNA alkylation repair protein [Polyangiaceae bacterium]